MQKLTLNFEIVKKQKYPGSNETHLFLIADVPELNSPTHLNTLNSNDLKIIFNIEGFYFKEFGENYFNISSYKDVGWSERGRDITDKVNGTKIAYYRGNDVELLLNRIVSTHKFENENEKELLQKIEIDKYNYLKSFQKLTKILSEFENSEIIRKEATKNLQMDYLKKIIIDTSKCSEISSFHIFIHSNVVIVNNYMSMNQSLEALSIGGPEQERYELTDMRNLLFNEKKDNILKFDSEEKIIRFKKEFFIRNSEINWFKSTAFILDDNNTVEKTLLYVKSKINDLIILQLNLYDHLDVYLNTTLKNLLEYENILKKTYYSAGEIEIGIHGPEINEEKLYLSVFHYLELKNLNPFDYNTFDLGNYLTSISQKVLKCKYKDQNFQINKFDFDLLNEEFENFQKYKI